MKIHCLQHVSFETPGTIIDWVERNGHSISYTCFFEENHSLPALDGIDALLIMGGYMNVEEEEKFPWLVREKHFIREAFDSGKKIIGICLGAQLIAASLGAKVYKAKEKEIGFFPVTFTRKALGHSLFNHFKNPYPVFHWHGDTFDLPDWALRIATTTVCENQAFLIGKNVLGMQFHPEMNEPIIEALMLHDATELSESGAFIQNSSEIKNQYNHLHQNRDDLFLLLDKFM